MHEPPALESLILQLLRDRRAGVTICPSQVARADRSGAWRTRMGAVRDAARELARQRRICVLQRGCALGPAGAWRGPVRLARGPRFDDEDW